MSKLGRLLLLGCVTALAGLGLVACGGGSSGGGGSNGGTATVLMGTAPDYLALSTVDSAASPPSEAATSSTNWDRRPSSISAIR